MTTRTDRLLCLLLLGAAPLAGCGGDQIDDDEIGVVRSALGVTGFPAGLTCGLSYTHGGVITADGICNGVPTLGGGAAAGFRNVADGDRGLPAGQGFFHQAFNGDANITAANSNQVLLPKGTACGFKEACNDSGERCLGFDPNAGQCPPGWLAKVSSDLNAPSGCGFVWCEYQDPNNLCTSEACLFNNVPMGITCGITDNDRNNGQCLGVSVASPPPNVGRCGGAPNNDYYFSGFFDDGRSAGHGVGFCSRLLHDDYHNGKFMNDFTIYPIFFGNWTTAAKDSQQSFLNGMAGFITGTGAPAGRSPFTRQYGVMRATVNAYVSAATSKTKLTDADLRGAITTLQNAGTIPAYAANRLFMVFPATGIIPNRCGQPGADGACDNIVWVGYHRSVSQTGYYGITFADAGPSLSIVSSHEVFEAATDPAWNSGSAGWNNDTPGNAITEICDYCAGPGGTFFANGVSMAQCYDNDNWGTCNNSGYIFNPPAPSACGRLLASNGEGLVANTVGAQNILDSCDGRFRLQMQSDGNLTLTQLTSGIRLWATNTSGQPITTAVMQPDGNFVLNRSFNKFGPDARWATGTNPSGSAFWVQDDGNLVVYDSGGTPLWASNTCCH